jgi:hypothetical protein
MHISKKEYSVTCIVKLCMMYLLMYFSYILSAFLRLKTGVKNTQYFPTSYYM